MSQLKPNHFLILDYICVACGALDYRVVNEPQKLLCPECGGDLVPEDELPIIKIMDSDPYFDGWHGVSNYCSAHWSPFQPHPSSSLPLPEPRPLRRALRVHREDYNGLIGMKNLVKWNACSLGREWFLRRFDQQCKPIWIVLNRLESEGLTGWARWLRQKLGLPDV